MKCVCYSYTLMLILIGIDGKLLYLEVGIVGLDIVGFKLCLS